MAKPVFRLEQKAGDPIQWNGVKLVPFAQSLYVQNPFWRMSGLIWNRPSSVLVVAADGQEQVLPIRDLTRWVQFSLLGAGFVGAMLIWWLNRGYKKE